MQQSRQHGKGQHEQKEKAHHRVFDLVRNRFAVKGGDEYAVRADQVFHLHLRCLIEDLIVLDLQYIIVEI